MANKLTVLDQTHRAQTSTQRAITWVSLFVGLFATIMIGGWTAFWIHLGFYGVSTVIVYAVYKDIERTGQKPKSRYIIWALQEITCLAMAYYGENPWVGLVPWAMSIVSMIVDRMEGRQHSTDEALNQAVAARRAEIARERFIEATAAYLARQAWDARERHLMEMDVADADAVRTKLAELEAS